MNTPVHGQRTVLFVAYGSGHIRMVIPVALALAQAAGVRVLVLALTTAAKVARQAGLEVVQFKDFVTEADSQALQWGRELMGDLTGPVEDPEEAIAYLGLSMADLVERDGLAEARRAYEQHRRQAFLPERTLARILQTLRPHLVVATNSPRAERAAIQAAVRLGTPAICMVDLFALDEYRWIGQPGYANRICVLNAQVKDFLVGCGRRPDEIVVTGNPAFDALGATTLGRQARDIRAAHGWQGKRVLLWPSQMEPLVHPFDGRRGDPQLPHKLLAMLADWVSRRPDTVLCVRPRAGEDPPPLPGGVLLTGQDWPLPALLHAVDLVVTLSSTVGLEGFLAGARVIQVFGSVFDEAMPLARFGLADTGVELGDLEPALDRWSAAPRRPTGPASPATPRVLEVIREFL